MSLKIIHRITVTMFFSCCLLVPVISSAQIQPANVPVNSLTTSAPTANTAATTIPAPASIPQIYVSNFPVTGTTEPTVFDKHFISLLRRWGVPGASVTIMRHGQILLSHGYGWSDVRERQPVMPYSLFRVGSVSKAVTAITVLRLVQEGKLRLDDKVFSVLNDLSPLDGLEQNPGINNITIRNLLQMASGWQTDVIDPMFGPWSVRMMRQLAEINDPVPPSCETAARMMMGIPLRSRPGTQYSYSNINYCILGLLANKANNTSYNYQNYETYVRQNILASLGIYDMRIGDTLPQYRTANEVKYYTYPGYSSPDTSDLVPSPSMAQVDGLPYSNSQILKKNYSDGGWIASSVDLAKFLQGIFNHQILNPNMISVMVEKPTYRMRAEDNYFAMGFNVKRLNGRTYWVKTGSFTGTYAVIIQGLDGTSYAAVFNLKPSQRVSFLAQLQRILITAT